MVKRRITFLAAFVFVVSTSDAGVAQETIPFVPSPPHVVEKMIEVAEIKKGDILYDMGSGDGRIVIEAAKKYGIRGVGIDLNPELVAKARENAKIEGVSHLVEFRAQDGLTVDISEATVVTLYMFKWFNNALKPSCKTKTRLPRRRPRFRYRRLETDQDRIREAAVRFHGLCRIAHAVYLDRRRDAGDAVNKNREVTPSDVGYHPFLGSKSKPGIPSFAARLNGRSWRAFTSRKVTGRFRCCWISTAARGTTRTAGPT